LLLVPRMQGAAAVLEFHAIDSPLAQPRNAILSQLLASVIGTTISTVFQQSAHFGSLRWLGGALSCSVATSVMALTGTVHPPAGATALLAVVSDDSIRLGWYLVPLVMMGCAIMTFMALVLNNIQRRFPVYWWRKGDLDGAGVCVEEAVMVDAGGQDPTRMAEEGRLGAEKVEMPKKADL
jgi:CBS-domain-containing membrane protein